MAEESDRVFDVTIGTVVVATVCIPTVTLLFAFFLLIPADVEEVVECAVEDEPLRPILLDGVSYYIDSDNLLYHETEDGYEQVGSYDPKKDTVELLITEEEEEQEEETDEEEGIEVEEFVYKGKTYQRDSENTVYLDGEEIGTWDGKRIVRIISV